MHWGIVNLFCPVCGGAVRLDGNRPSGTMHHKEFGTVCKKECFERAEFKYARMILGKDDE